MEYLWIWIVTVVSWVGWLAVDVARAPAHSVIGVAGGLTRAVRKPDKSKIKQNGLFKILELRMLSSVSLGLGLSTVPLLHVAAVESIPVTAVHRRVMWLSPLLGTLPPRVSRLRVLSKPVVATDQGIAARVHRVTRHILQTHPPPILFVATQNDRPNHLLAVIMIN